MNFKNIVASSQPVEEKEVQYKDFTFKVKQYLPATQKNIIIEKISMLGGALEGRRHPFIEQVAFELELVANYTDIEFTDEEMGKHFFTTYDMLEREGIIDLTIQHIPEQEYNEFVEISKDTLTSISEHSTSFAKIGNASETISKEAFPQLINTLTNIAKDDFPKMLELIVDSIDKVDLDKVDKFIDFVGSKLNAPEGIEIKEEQ